jgi:hypothetical protein
MTYAEFNKLSPGDMIRYVFIENDYYVCLSGPIRGMSDDRKTVKTYNLFLICNRTNKIQKTKIFLNRWEVVYENK